jgi:DNA-binding transcriptional ArsR family regulator
VNTYGDPQLNALGDPTRRAILSRLLNGPLPVGELARDLPVSRPAISQHLRVLKQAELVLDQPEGNRRLYRLNPAGFESLREYLDQFWSQALAAFAKKVEEESQLRKELQ